MRSLLDGKDASQLSLQSKEFFIGNKNEIWYYTDWKTGRNYARARFEWDGTDWRFDCWYLLNHNDIKDDEAFTNTAIAINRDFGYVARRVNEL